MGRRDGQLPSQPELLEDEVVLATFTHGGPAQVAMSLLWMLLVTHPSLTSSWWEAGLVADMEMGEPCHWKTLVHILGFSS